MIYPDFHQGRVAALEKVHNMDSHSDIDSYMCVFITKRIGHKREFYEILHFTQSPQILTNNLHPNILRSSFHFGLKIKFFRFLLQ